MPICRRDISVCQHLFFFFFFHLFKKKCAISAEMYLINRLERTSHPQKRKQKTNTNKQTNKKKKKTTKWWIHKNKKNLNKLKYFSSSSFVATLNTFYCLIISSPDTKGHVSLKPLCQFGSNLAGMVFGWSPFRIVSDDPACQPRWPPWLKIENSAKKIIKNLLVWNYLANWDQTLKEWSLDGLLFRIVSDDLHLANQGSRHQPT